LYIKTFNFYKTALLHCNQQSGITAENLLSNAGLSGLLLGRKGSYFGGIKKQSLKMGTAGRNRELKLAFTRFLIHGA